MIKSSCAISFIKVDKSNSLETDNVTSIPDDGDIDSLIIKAINCLIMTLVIVKDSSLLFLLFM